MNKEETIIINDELFYRILNGTSYDYAPIPKEFKPYFERLQQENKELHNKIDKAIKELDRVITFCKNDSQGGYDICNMAIRNYKNVRSLLKDSDVDE